MTEQYLKLPPADVSTWKYRGDNDGVRESIRNRTDTIGKAIIAAVEAWPDDGMEKVSLENNSIGRLVFSACRYSAGAVVAIDGFTRDHFRGPTGFHVVKITGDGGVLKAMTYRESSKGFNIGAIAKRVVEVSRSASKRASARKKESQTIRETDEFIESLGVKHPARVIQDNAGEISVTVDCGSDREKVRRVVDAIRAAFAELVEGSV